MSAGEQQRALGPADGIARDPAKDHLANTALGISAHDDQVSVKIIRCFHEASANIPWARRFNNFTFRCDATPSQPLRHTL